MRESIVLFSINDVYNVFATPEHGGGFAPLLTLLDAERGRARAADRDHWFFGCGDLIAASPELCPEHRGRHVADALNAMGMDAAVFGNHEFETGTGPVRDVMRRSRFPWLGTNVSERDGSPLGSGRWHIVETQRGHHVGLIGLCTPRTEIMMVATDREVRFDPVVPAALQAVRELREGGGVDAIVALTHLHLDEDRRLARDVPEVDLILGGHEHRVTDVTEGATRILKCGQDARFLGRVVLEIGGGHRTRVAACDVLPNRDLLPHPRIAALLDGYGYRVAPATAAWPAASDVVATLGRALDSRSVRYGESAFANMIVDALARAHPNVALFVVHGGLFKARRTYPADHRLTVGDVTAEIPRHYLCVFALVDGVGIRAAVEHALSRFGEDGENPSLLHVSDGWHYRYDPAAPPGRRLASLRTDRHRDNTGGTEREVHDGDWFLVGMSRYLAMGGDGFGAFRDAIPYPTPDPEGVPLALAVCKQLAAECALGSPDPCDGPLPPRISLVTTTEHRERSD